METFGTKMQCTDSSSPGNSMKHRGEVFLFSCHSTLKSLKSWPLLRESLLNVGNEKGFRRSRDGGMNVCVSLSSHEHNLL